MAGFNWTDDVRLAFRGARDEAWALDQREVDVEHILLALLHTEAEVAIPVLTPLGVDLNALRRDLLSALPRGGFGSTDFEGIDRPFTHRAKQMLEGSERWAYQHLRPYIASEHVLLAMLSEEGGLAGQALASRGLTVSQLRSIA